MINEHSLDSKWGHDEAMEEREALQSPSLPVEVVDSVKLRKEQAERAYEEIMQAYDRSALSARNNFASELRYELKQKYLEAGFDTLVRAKKEHAYNLVMVHSSLT